MSRLAVGIGSGLGAVAGSVAGYYVNRYTRITRDTQFAELVGAVAGAVIGAAVSVNNNPPKQSGAVSGPPLVPRFL